MRNDVDAVLTTRELAVLIKSRKIPFSYLSDDAKYDSPLGQSSLSVNSGVRGSDLSPEEARAIWLPLIARQKNVV